MNYYMPTKRINLELDKFLEICNLPALNQKETENPNQPTMSKRIESVMQNLPRKKSPEPDDFSG